MRTFNWKKRRLEKSSDGARVTFSVGHRVGLFFSRPSPERLSAEARSEGGGGKERGEKKQRGRSWSGRDANRVAMAVAVKVKFVNETSGTAGKPK